MKKKSLTTMQILVLGFVILTLAGTVVLMQRISISGENNLSFVDALFTATSAVTTTGLVVVDTGTFFSTFGQVVILILFQIGGLGYMIFIALLMLGIGKRLSFSNVHLLHESIGRPSSEDLLKFSKKIILFTLFFEIVGVVLFCSYWSKFFSLPEALYTSVFHSVSAFCTAGFSLYSDNLTAYRDSVFFNISVLSICFAGSVGFFVLNDLYHYGKRIVRKRYPRGFSPHTKLAVPVLAALTIVGTISMYLCLVSDQAVVQGAKTRAISSLFQIASATTTTGFNTIDIGALNNPILWSMIVLMFIGACPGGTAGGIKTTTFGLILLSVRSMLTGKKDVHLFYRKAPSEMVMRAFAVAAIALAWIVAAMCIVLITDAGLSFQAVLFEVTSAFGTVGLSTGVTSSLSTAGKIVVALTMLFGRLGPIAVGYSLVGKPKPASFAYPKAEILIG